MRKQSAVSDSIDSPAQRGCTLARAARLLWPALATVAVMAATAAQLHWQGRRWWCVCGQWFL